MLSNTVSTNFCETLQQKCNVFQLWAVIGHHKVCADRVQELSFTKSHIKHRCARLNASSIHDIRKNTSQMYKRELQYLVLLFYT